MELYQIIEAGPEASGYPSGCWRSTMIQYLIHKNFGIFFSTKGSCLVMRHLSLCGAASPIHGRPRVSNRKSRQLVSARDIRFLALSDTGAENYIISDFRHA